MLRRLIPTIALSTLFTACAAPPPAEPPAALSAFTGASIFDGTGGARIDDGVLLVRDGRIVAVGAAGDLEVPPSAERVDVSGKTIVPGLVNAHGHVGDVVGLEPGHYSEENVLSQLALYARYGVTTVVSLGGDDEAGIRVRDGQDDPGLDRARLFLAGPVVDARTPEEARSQVHANAELGVDVIKIRVDDNLGTSEKMPPEVYRAVIDEAHAKGLGVAAHLWYLNDAKALLEAGVDFLAHSVRDREVDTELAEKLKSTGVCYCPTLAREVSIFAYAGVPEFFSDPFFLREADPAVVEALADPERRRRLSEDPTTEVYREALRTAQTNLKTLADAGVTVALGTDSGPPARFQGYFEHLELDLMAEAGLSAPEIFRAATANAARCLGLDEVGTLEPGKWADFLVLAEDPSQDVAKLRTLESVWIAGNRVPER